MEKQELRINVSEIPDCVREDLARATLELVKNILSQPGGRAMLDKETERRRLSTMHITSQQEK